MTLWGAYVRDLTRSAASQQEVADQLGVAQPTIGRWKRGENVPTEAGLVAVFCRLYGRNPVEGFVAAGMLTEDEAGRGLSAKSRRYLMHLRQDLEAAGEAAEEIRRGMQRQPRPPNGADSGTPQTAAPGRP